jgi:hypothetical protein
MKGKNGILLFVEFLKGLLEDRKIGIRNPRIKQIRYTSFTIEEKDTNVFTRQLPKHLSKVKRR